MWWGETHLVPSAQRGYWRTRKVALNERRFDVATWTKRKVDGDCCLPTDRKSSTAFAASNSSPVQRQRVRGSQVIDYPRPRSKSHSFPSTSGWKRGCCCCCCCCVASEHRHWAVVVQWTGVRCSTTALAPPVLGQSARRPRRCRYARFQGPPHCPAASFAIRAPCEPLCKQQVDARWTGLAFAARKGDVLPRLEPVLPGVGLLCPGPSSRVFPLSPPRRRRYSSAPRGSTLGKGTRAVAGRVAASVSGGPCSGKGGRNGGARAACRGWASSSSCGGCAVPLPAQERPPRLAWRVDGDGL